MRFLLVLSMTSALAGCVGAQATRVTAKPRPGCPSEAASVGTWAWIEANRAQRVAEHSPRVGDLVGLVMDHAGMPLAGVEVAMLRGRIPPGDTVGVRVRRTNGAGKFQFDSLAANDYVLRIREPGFEIQWRQYRGITAPVDSLCVYLRAAPPPKLSPLRY